MTQGDTIILQLIMIVVLLGIGWWAFWDWLCDNILKDKEDEDGIKIRKTK